MSRRNENSADNGRFACNGVVAQYCILTVFLMFILGVSTYVYFKEDGDKEDLLGLWAEGLSIELFMWCMYCCYASLRANNDSIDHNPAASGIFVDPEKGSKINAVPSDSVTHEQVPLLEEVAVISSSSYKV